MIEDKVKAMEDCALSCLRLALYAAHFDAREECIRQAMDYIRQADNAISANVSPINLKKHDGNI